MMRGQLWEKFMKTDGYVRMVRVRKCLVVLIPFGVPPFLIQSLHLCLCVNCMCMCVCVFVHIHTNVVWAWHYMYRKVRRQHQVLVLDFHFCRRDVVVACYSVTELASCEQRFSYACF